MTGLARRPHRWCLAATGAAFLGFAAVALPWTLAFDLVRWAPRSDGVWAIAAVVMVKPALLEELVFRGPLLLVPLRWAMAASLGLLALFVLAHPLNAAFLEPGLRPWFFDARFLAVVALLGGVAGWLTRASGRLYPAVLFHWAVVVIWLFLLGGPHPGGPLGQNAQAQSATPVPTASATVSKPALSSALSRPFRSVATNPTPP